MLAAIVLAALFEPYSFKTFDNRDVAAERGAVTVPEARGGKDGAQRKVVFVRLKSAAAKPAPPIVFLMGGPGIPGSVMLRVPPYYDLFEKLTSNADVIVVDYRGVGMSEPLLDCKYAQAPPLSSEPALRDWLRANVRWCTDQWRKRGLDARNYSAEAIADDVDAIRAELGAGKISLLAFSYGTDVALAAIQRHPERLDRVVLASVDAPDAGLKRPALWDLQLRRVAPELERAVRTLGPRLDVQALLRTSMGSARSFEPSAKAIEGLARGDAAPFEASVAKLSAGLQSSGMGIALGCLRPRTPARRALVAAEAKGALFSAVNLQLDESVCGVAVPAAPRIWSDVPALFISGALDANTPASEAEEVRFGFPRGEHFIVEGGWHETLTMPAVQERVIEFFSR